MNALDRLLDCDRYNVDIAKGYLINVEPSALDLIESCACALNFLSHEFGRVCAYDKLQEELEVAAGKIPGYSLEMLGMIHDSMLIGESDRPDPISIAREAVFGELSVLARALLGLRLGREFLFGMSDLLRFRVSTSMGVLRAQAESVALISLMATDADLGKKWLETTDDEKGKRFHRETHSRVVDEIRKLGLLHDYQRGSNMALHPRASGIAKGYLNSKPLSANDGRLEMTFQEVCEPPELLFWFCCFIRFHSKVVERACEIYPEFNADILQSTELRRFRDQESEVRARAAQVVKKWREKEA